MSANEKKEQHVEKTEITKLEVKELSEENNNKIDCANDETCVST